MLIKSTDKKGTFDCDTDGAKLIDLIDSLWWGRDRWDSSTETVMNEIADLLEMGKEDEE
jgi:hypothetical protein